MVMNYKELGKHHLGGEWGKGVGMMNATAEDLRRKGLLPVEFPHSENLKGVVLPEGAIRLPDITTVGMSNEEMERLADSTRGLNVGDWGRDIIKRAPIAPKELLTLSPVALDARTMGIRDEHPATKEVWDKAKKFGDRVTAEKMLQIAIEAAKGNIQVEIGKPLVGIMEPVTDSGGLLNTLYVGRYEDGLWLDADYANPGYQRDPVTQFVVSARK